MYRKLELALRVFAITACVGLSAAVAADAPAAQSAPNKSMDSAPSKTADGASNKSDAIDAAITRSNDLAQRAAQLAEEATKQKAELEALRSRSSEDSRRRTGEAAVQAKDLQEARGRITALQAEVGELRGAAADAKAAAQAQAESAQKLQQKDAEIAKLRAEVEKLQKTVAEARTERDGVRAAAAAKPAAEPRAIQPAVATSAAPAAASPATIAPAVAAAAAAEASTDAAIPPPPDASAIKKWMKPDGSLYFGERPPEGSKFVGYTTGGGL